MTPSLLAASKGGREIASSRYRVHDLLPNLRGHGWRIETLTPSMERRDRLRNALRDLRLARRRWDVLLVQRPGRRREEEILLRLAGRRARVVAVDVDDPVEERGAHGWAVRRADIVFVGSRALERAFAARAARVEYVPTSLDVGRYDLPRARHGSPVVGWIGDAPAYADSLLRMLEGVAASRGAWRVRIVGTRGDQALERKLRAAVGNIPLEFVAGVSWEDEDEVAAQVASFDVGLAPFRSAEGGSFKTVQYLAAGVVPVVEANGEAEEHARLALGDDAHIVRVGDSAGVTNALERLSDPDNLARLSERCRDAARRHYARDAAADRIDAVLREALAISR